MTNPSTLIKFLTYIEDRYPANHSLLTIWGHGRGVYPDGQIPLSQTKGVIEDYTTGYGSDKTMSISDFSNAINFYKRKYNKCIDIIHFDSCSMQMIEICCQLKDCTDFIIGAETQIPGAGSDYEMIAGHLVYTSSIAPNSLCLQLSNHFINPKSESNSSFAFSAIRTDKIDSFLLNFDYFCKCLQEKMDMQNPSLYDIRDQLTQIDNSYSEYIDLHEFIKIVTTTFNIPNDQITQSLTNMMISSSRSKDFNNDIWGLGINFPQSKSEFKYYQCSYSNSILDFYLLTDWNLLLEDYYNKFLD